MVRKYFRRAQIYCLISIGVCTVTFAAPERQVVRAPSKTGSTTHDDRELRKNKDALDSLKTEIDKRRKKLKELSRDEGNFLSRLEYLASNERASRAFLLLVSNRIDSAEATIGRLTDSLSEASLLLRDRRTILKKRLRNAYMAGSPPAALVILMSRNPLDAVHRVRYLQETHGYDRSIVDKIETIRTGIDTKKETWLQERLQLAALLQQKKDEHRMMLAEEASRKKLLDDIRSKKKATIALMAELEEAQREVKSFITALAAKRKKNPGPARTYSGGGTFAQQKGLLPWPYTGTITARFGRIVHPVYHTVIMNNGIDMAGSGDFRVRSVAAGTVLYIGTLRGLGRIVIVDHSSGYMTIYAQLETISAVQNDRVAAGTVIGATGRSGDVQFHFEIRHLSESLDPLTWLEKTRR